MNNFWDNPHRGWKINGIEVSPKVFFLALPMIAIIETLASVPRKAIDDAVNAAIGMGICLISALAGKQ